jgi:hypothetical protein
MKNVLGTTSATMLMENWRLDLLSYSNQSLTACASHCLIKDSLGCLGQALHAFWTVTRVKKKIGLQMGDITTIRLVQNAEVWVENILPLP